MMRRFAGGAASAVALLTILPAPSADSQEGDLARGAVWFPLVGALLGALAGGVRILAEPLGALPATALALATMTALTGALHQDGLADTADGIGARGEPTRRLAAMRDHAVGTFGVLALLWWGLLMLTTLAALTDTQALRALILAGVLSRLAAVLHAAVTRPARADGLGASFDVAAPTAALAGALAVAIVAATVGPLAGGTALAAALLSAAMLTIWARRSLGGRTGDTIGATVAIAEVAVCIALLTAWRA